MIKFSKRRESTAHDSAWTGFEAKYIFISMGWNALMRDAKNGEKAMPCNHGN